MLGRESIPAEDLVYEDCKDPFLPPWLGLNKEQFVKKIFILQWSWLCSWNLLELKAKVS